MNCLIDEALKRYADRAHKVEVIRRYIRLKYHISIDRESMKQRLKALAPSTSGQVGLS